MKTVLVTGGTHGIGSAIVDELISKDYKVYSCARGELKTNVNFIKCNLLLKDDINTLIKTLPEVDILICNAGGGGRWGDENWLITNSEVWQEVYDKNVGYIIHLMNHYLHKMIENKWGRVITISSILGKESSDSGRPWFQVAKSAQISLMKSYSKNKDYVRNGITFNTVSPGAIMIEDTGWYKMHLENKEEYENFIESLPMGKIGNSKDVANAVSFLCSDKSNYINGSNIVIDGGQSYSF